MVTKNKKGWIRIIEAFIAIILIWSVMLIIISGSLTERKDSSHLIYNKQVLILREIQLNDTLRDDILNIDQESLPIGNLGDYSDTNPDFPNSIQNILTEKIPPFLRCEAQICLPEDDCNFLRNVQIQEKYSQEALIFTRTNEYNPRKIKLFCRVRN